MTRKLLLGATLLASVVAGIAAAPAEYAGTAPGLHGRRLQILLGRDPRPGARVRLPGPEPQCDLAAVPRGYGCVPAAGAASPGAAGQQDPPKTKARADVQTKPAANQRASTKTARRGAEPQRSRSLIVDPKSERQASAERSWVRLLRTMESRTLDITEETFETRRAIERAAAGRFHGLLGHARHGAADQRAAQSRCGWSCPDRGPRSPAAASTMSRCASRAAASSFSISPTR